VALFKLLIKQTSSIISNEFNYYKRVQLLQTSSIITNEYNYYKRVSNIKWCGCHWSQSWHPVSVSFDV